MGTRPGPCRTVVTRSGTLRRGGPGSQDAVFWRQARSSLQFSVDCIAALSPENFSCWSELGLLATPGGVENSFVRVGAHQQLELATPGCVGRARPSPGRSRCDGRGREGACSMAGWLRGTSSKLPRSFRGGTAGSTEFRTFSIAVGSITIGNVSSFLGGSPVEVSARRVPARLGLPRSRCCRRSRAGVGARCLARCCVCCSARCRVLPTACENVSFS